MSKDLRAWRLLYLEGTASEFNHHMSVQIGRSFVACCTGKKLIIFSIDEIERALRKEPVIVEYGAYIDCLKGLLYKVRRMKPRSKR